MHRLVFVALAMIQAAPPEHSTRQALPFDPAAWIKLPQVTLRVTEREKLVVYEGIPLATVLKERLPGKGTMAELRALADSVILVKAADGYQAAISAAAVAMDPKGERFLLALRRDGQPLDKGQAPVRLVVPGDPQHIRWVRMISGLELVTLRASE